MPKMLTRHRIWVSLIHRIPLLLQQKMLMPLLVFLCCYSAIAIDPIVRLNQGDIQGVSCMRQLLIVRETRAMANDLGIKYLSFSTFFSMI